MFSLFRTRPVSSIARPKGLRFLASSGPESVISQAKEMARSPKQSGNNYRTSRVNNFPLSRSPSTPNTLGGRGKPSYAEKEVLPDDGKLRVGYVLHCKFTSNNTIITLTSQYRRVGKLAEKLSPSDQYLDKVRPCEDVVINLTAGLVGFRNTKQGEYEAGFQTAKRMFELMNERKLLDLPIEVIMSNFGKGREAFVNALNGSEGNAIRPNIARVSDGTKIKIGGVREPRARRV